MTIQEFTAAFAAQLDDTDPSLVTPSTRFKELDEWSSLTALMIIAMADDEYEVQLKGDDIAHCETIEALFNVVKSKK